MSFNLKFVSTMLKRNLVSAILCVLATALVIAVIAMSAVSSALIKYVSESYERTISGDADIKIETGNLSPDRFFGMTEIRSNAVIADNTEYVKGYFNTFVNVLDAKGNRDFSSLIVSSIRELYSYNPIEFKDEPHESLSRDEVLISEQYARQNGLRVDDLITVTFGSTASEYRVAGIAKDEGIFYYGCLIFMEEAGFRKLFPLYSQGLVTHCFVKVKAEKSFDLVLEELKRMHPNFSVTNAVQGYRVQSFVELIDIPFKSIAFLAAAFSTVALFVLTALFFNPLKQNFEILRVLGMKRRQIKLFGVLICLIIGGIAAIFSVPLIYVFVAILKSAVSLAKDFSIGFFAYFISVFIGLSLQIIAALLFCKVEYRKKTILKTSSLRIASVKPVKIQKSLLVVKARAVGKSSLWRFFMGFFCLSIAVMLTTYQVIYSANQRKESMKNSFCFDLTISNIASPSDSFFESVLNTSGVDNAFKADVNTYSRVNFKDLYAVALVLGLEKDGVEYICGSKAQVGSFDGALDGALLGRVFALKYGITVGDRITTEVKGESLDFTVAGLVDNSFYEGMFVLVNLESLKSKERPYSNIFVNSQNLKETIDSLYSQYPVSNLAIVNNRQVAEKVYFNASIFVRFLTILSMLVTTVALGAVVIMLYLWRKGEEQFSKKLSYLGLTRGGYTWIFSSVLAIYLLPATILAVFIALLLSKLFLPLGLLFNSYQSISFSALVAFVAVLALYSVFVLAGILLSHKKKSKHFN